MSFTATRKRLAAALGCALVLTLVPSAEAAQRKVRRKTMLRPVKIMKRPPAGKKVDVAIMAAKMVTSPRAIKLSGRGTWVNFQLKVVNKGTAVARCVDVIVKHKGEEWPTEGDHITYLRPRVVKSMRVRVQVPPTAKVGKHTLMAIVDPDSLNKDANPTNNKRVFAINVLPSKLPDLCITKVQKTKKDGAKHIPRVRRGYFHSGLKVSVFNKGKVKSAPCKLDVFVLVQDGKKIKEKAHWKYNVPALVPRGGTVINVDRFKAYVGSCYETTITVDEPDIVNESNEDNNAARSRVVVKCKNPIANLFQRFKKSAKKGAKKAKSWCIEKGKYVWRKGKYKSAPLLADAMTPLMMAYVRSSREIHEKLGRKLRANERQVLSKYFPEKYLNRCRVHHAKKWARPEFWADYRGLACEHVIIINKKDKITLPLLAHELTHSYQYAKYGLQSFCYHYLLSWLRNGYTNCSFEKQARAMAARVENNTPIMVEDLLGY